MLVSLEGGDGAGKSTVAAGCVKALQAQGLDAVLIVPKKPAIADAFLHSYLDRFSRVLWETDGEEPRQLFSTEHWVNLSAAWYEIVDRHVVRPALETHAVVVLDSWYHKLMARFRLKRDVTPARLEAAYARLTRPDLTLYLDVDPRLAAERKDTFGQSECGNLDGLSGRTAENFILYQSWVRAIYQDLATASAWSVISVDHLDESQAIEAATTAIMARYDADMAEADAPDVRKARARS